MRFCEKLQNLRKNSGMTQLELAEKLMVSRQAISKWETGNAIPDLENIISICDLFGVSVDYLVRDVHDKEEEIVQNTIKKAEQQGRKKISFRRKIVLILILIVTILFVGWKMNIVAITVILIIWAGILGGVYWGGKKLLALLSK